MKKTFLFLLLAVLLGAGLQSCDRENENGGNNGGNTSVQWVDLGLPSGLQWADRNVGAKSAEDYGNYYAWGETAPKEVYDWSTYAYGNGYNQLTKYCNKTNYGLNGFKDNLSTLEASDDAATVNIGGEARMPSNSEWQELIDNTTSTWTTRNGVYGLLLTGSNRFESQPRGRERQLLVKYAVCGRSVRSVAHLILLGLPAYVRQRQPRPRVLCSRGACQ